MVRQSDLSAPACNDCHGNHGAAPPGVGAIANVCGTCHTVFATKFALSTHSQIFDRGCVECHGNHEIAKPADAMLGTDKTALYGNCHSEGDNGHKAATAMRSEIEKLKDAIARSQALVASAENAGMEMGDQSLALREAGNHLTLARTEMYAFDPKAVLTVAPGGPGHHEQGGRGGSGRAGRGVVPQDGPRRLARRHSAGGGRAQPEDPGAQIWRVKALAGRAPLARPPKRASAKAGRAGIRTPAGC